ncbi:hypothetical protein VTJ83DRAFT_896 [Remersonia thermophila]|uniref:F-box domain-containing protein n=1 Tax=Remersonia thermophila TaxID=72144 RepID=A0ABR4DMJ8_9PEZI
MPQPTPKLPPEIWRLVVQALIVHNGFYVNGFLDLYQFSRVCMGFAALALPELYSIQHKSFTQLPSLWHSILASTLGTTLFPYYLWITEIDLTSCEYFVRQQRPGQSPLFSHPLEMLDIRKPDGNLDHPAIVTEMVNLLTSPTRRPADDETTQGSLSFLKTGHFSLPPSRLASWVSGFRRLKLLQALEVGVLDGTVGSAIRASCPAFTGVRIIQDSSRSANFHHLGAFIQNLKPDSLEKFEMIHTDHISKEPIQALSLHARSLKALILQSLVPSAFASLTTLQRCRSLESLVIRVENDDFSYDWKARRPQLLQDVTQWISNCGHLQELVLIDVPIWDSIVPEILQSPLIRLRRLVLNNPKTEMDEGFCSALSRQTELQCLVLTSYNRDDTTPQDDRWEARNAQLCRAIASCRNLQQLDLGEPLSHASLEHICRSTPHMEILHLRVLELDDRFLEPIGGLGKLRSLALYSQRSTFTYTAVRRLLGTFAADPEGKRNHGTLHIVFSGKHPPSSFTQQDLARLRPFCSKHFGGAIDVWPFPLPGAEPLDPAAADD